jgi:hypothetical protein
MQCFNGHGERTLLLNSWTLLSEKSNSYHCPSLHFEPLSEPSPCIEPDQSESMQAATTLSRRPATIAFRGRRGSTSPQSLLRRAPHEDSSSNFCLLGCGDIEEKYVTGSDC